MTLYDAFLESSAETPGGPADPFMMWAKTLGVPRNSGIQNVLPDVFQAYERAKLLRPPYRYIAMRKVKAWLYGLAGISSEGGFFARELNTQRVAQHQTMQTNQGPEYDEYDKFFYPKDHFSGNPKGKGDSLKLSF